MTRYAKIGKGKQEHQASSWNELKQHRKGKDQYDALGNCMLIVRIECRRHLFKSTTIETPEQCVKPVQS